MSAGVVALASCLPAEVLAQPQAPASSPAAAPRTGDVQPLADGIWLLPGRFERGRQPDGNSVLLQGREGLVLIDSGRHAEHTGALIEWARARGQPIRVVLNTHWHLDHLGGNAMLREAVPGLRSLASAAVRDAVAERMPRSAADLRRMLADPATDAQTRRMVEIDLALLERRAALAPDELVGAAPHEIAPAGRRLQVGVERGVSGGDLWVLDRASGILVIGDFVTLPVPFFDTACAELWRDALARLGELPFTRVVPGHGPVMDGEVFRRYVRAFGRLVDCAASEEPAAACAARWAEDLGPLLPEPSRRGATAMLSHYFDAVLRAPPAQRRQYCPA
ncbi:MAG: MBL fold metallo-hydrolase [Burkholderiales bacterium]|nr:MBL fold metallo-hydrolase [Burkholderiales bacterium]